MNEGFKEFVIVDFLYAPVTVIHNDHRRNKDVEVDVNVVSSVLIPNDVAIRLHQALSEYLENYANK